MKEEDAARIGSGQVNALVEDFPQEQSDVCLETRTDNCLFTNCDKQPVINATPVIEGQEASGEVTRGNVCHNISFKEYCKINIETIKTVNHTYVNPEVGFLKHLAQNDPEQVQQTTVQSGVECAHRQRHQTRSKLPMNPSSERRETLPFSPRGKSLEKTQAVKSVNHRSAGCKHVAFVVAVVVAVVPRRHLDRARRLFGPLRKTTGCAH